MLIIFDVDGTLTDKKKVMAARLQAQHKSIAEKKGITLEQAKKAREAAKKRLTKGKDVTKGKGLSSAYIFQALGFSREEFFKVINSVDVEKITKPQPGCRETLSGLSKKYTLVTYTNTPSEANAKTLEAIDLKKYFKKSFCADRLEESKPSTRNIRRIIKEMEARPEETIMVGDSYEKDILPAEEIGIKAVLFDPDNKHEDSSADYRIKNFKELVSLKELK